MSFGNMKFESTAYLTLVSKPIDPGFSEYKEGQYGKLRITYLNNPLDENGNLYEGFMSASPKIAYKFQSATKCEPVVSQMILNDKLVDPTTRTTSGTQFFDYTAFLSTDCLTELATMENIYISYSLRFITNETFFNPTIFDVINELVVDDLNKELKTKNLELKTNDFGGDILQRNYDYTIFDRSSGNFFIVTNGREELKYELSEDYLANGLWTTLGVFNYKSGELLTKNPLTVKSLKINLPFYKKEAVRVNTVFHTLEPTHPESDEDLHNYTIELSIDEETHYDLENSELKDGKSAKFSSKKGVILTNESLLDKGDFELIIEFKNASGVTEEFLITKQIDLKGSSVFDLFEVTENSGEKDEQFFKKYLFDENQILLNSHKDLIWEDFLSYESQTH